MRFSILKRWLINFYTTFQINLLEKFLIGLLNTVYIYYKMNINSFCHLILSSIFFNNYSKFYNTDLSNKIIVLF